MILSSCEKDEPQSRTFTDSRDGQEYKWIEIGDQIWMAENLNFDAGSGSWEGTYGNLYDWETACNVCPDGWHLPYESEWSELSGYLGGNSIAGGKMKETGTTHWNSPNTGATNSSGFSALPGGRFSDGYFGYLGSLTGFWSSDESYSGKVWSRILDYSNSELGYYYGSKETGFSVRCLSDE